MEARILAINPGSTSTKLALFAGESLLAERDVEHPREELAAFPRVMDQYPYRLAAVRRAFPAGELGRLDAVVGRGGLLAPMTGGTYDVTQAMVDDLVSARYGEHACNLGALLAREVAGEHGCPAFIVDPVVTDELDEVVRLTGLPEIRRRSVFHALNQRGVARTVAATLGVRYEDENFVVVHMGGGISIGAHRRGRVVDVTNGLDGEGPFTPERAGSLPVLSLLDLMDRQACPPAEMKQTVLTRGGLVAHLGVNDLRRAEALAREGDRRAALVLDALVLNIAKHAAAMAVVLHGPDRPGLRAVILTGGMAHSAWLTGALTERLSFLAPVVTVPGQEEMASLAAGTLLALAGRTPVREYRPGGA